MKKILYIFIAVLIFCIAFFIINKIKIDGSSLTLLVKEKTKGVFISYIEFELFDNKNEEETKKEIDKMINKVKEYNLNTIYLHVRPFSDSIYYSNIFPSSRYIVSKEGDELSFDLLDYFINSAHKNNIKIHAWINPYRISNQTDINVISKTNPAYKWLNTNNVKIIEGKGIYYNPASSEVIDLIVSGIKEIIDNYSVDGIIFDDYFYPDKTIDLDNYELVKDTVSIDDYRLNNVNLLIKKVYQTIKNKDSNILFGISPQGNISNNYNECYADIYSWLKEENYIDYIMPQLYYGFENESRPFINTLNEWIKLIQNNIKIIPALALYKSDKEDVYAKKGINEWINNSDIIGRQIKIIMDTYCDGYSLFSYQNLLDTDNINLKNEQMSIRNVNN